MSDKVNQVRTFEVLTATPSRRSPWQWSDDEKVRLVAEAFSPGGTVAEVARAYELDVSQLYAWRRKALSSGTMAPLTVPLDGRTMSESEPVKFTRFEAGGSATVEIVLGDVVVRVRGDIDPDQLAGIIGAVRNLFSQSWKPWALRCAHKAPLEIGKIISAHSGAESEVGRL